MESQAIRKAKSLFSLISIYLWIHGIGFDRTACCSKCCCLRIAASLLLLILVDGIAIYWTYRKLEWLPSLVDTHAGKIITTVLIFRINIIFAYILRYLFYSRRNALNDVTKKLDRLYAKVSSDEKSIDAFKLRLIAMMVINDGFYIYLECCTVNNLKKSLRETFSFAGIPYPYAIPIFCISYIIDTVFALVYAAVSAYFCTICFVLKQTLTEFNRRLQASTENDIFYLSLFCHELTAVISDINRCLHPLLVAAFTFICTKVFAQFHSSILYVSDDNLSLLFIADVLLSFSHLLWISLSASSVIAADSEVKLSVHKLYTKKHSKSNSIYLLQILNNTFQEFKILDSVVIDRSFIFRTVGGLLTYGMLVATFINSDYRVKAQ